MVLTGGADMELRVWCAITGKCAAVLQAGLRGVDKAFPGDKEPGGHRSGLVDVDFIDRGRNVISLDRGGWLRLWDVGNQVGIFKLINLLFRENYAPAYLTLNLLGSSLITSSSFCLFPSLVCNFCLLCGSPTTRSGNSLQLPSR